MSAGKNMTIKQAIESHFTVPDHIEALAYDVLRDLLYGPSVTSDDYPGFVSACKELREWYEQLPDQVYIDTDCDCVSETEPEDLEISNSYYLASRKEIASALIPELVVREAL